MTIVAYKTKKGIRYGYRFWKNGVLYKKRVGSKALAQKAEERERARLDTAAFEAQWGPLKPVATSWADAVKKYEEAKAHKASLAWDRRRLTWWGTFLSAHACTTLQQVTPSLVDKGKAQLRAEGLSEASLQRYLAVLRTLCNLAVRRWKLLRANPVLEVDWPKVKRTAPRIPTKAERQQLLANADQVVRPLILTALYTGLREGAIVRIQAEDFRARSGWLRCTDEKGEKEYFLPVAAPLAALVKELAVVKGPLFRGPDGKPMRRFPRERWEKARADAKLPWLTFHRLRHTCGTVLAEAGVPQRTIQAWLAHSSGQVTEIYTRPQEAGLLAAAQALADNLGV
ncbi:MAG: tyrosine-type recombinase/integrase [Candidatus Methylomirabilales bacterium]